MCSRLLLAGSFPTYSSLVLVGVDSGGAETVLHAVDLGRYTAGGNASFQGDRNFGHTPPTQVIVPFQSRIKLVIGGSDPGQPGRLPLLVRLTDNDASLLPYFYEIPSIPALMLWSQLETPFNARTDLDYLQGYLSVLAFSNATEREGLEYAYQFVLRRPPIDLNTAIGSMEVHTGQQQKTRRGGGGGGGGCTRTARRLFGDARLFFLSPHVFLVVVSFLFFCFCFVVQAWATTLA